MPVIALAAWGGALAAGAGVVWLLGLIGVLLGVATRPALRTLALASVLAALATAGLTFLAVHRTHDTPIAALADDHASVVVTGRVASDPRVTVGRFSETEHFTLRVQTMTSRGHSYRLSSPVLVMGPRSASHRVELGARLRLSGLLRPSDEPGVSAVLARRGEVEVLQRPRPWWRGAQVVRSSLRRSVAGHSPAASALVPALVVGDDNGLDPRLAAEFRTTGLTHLLAVSGTNLTLLVGFALLVARWVGVRGRGLYLVSVLGILGFLLLARAEPSVLRAAAMGSVALLALGQRGRARGGRALGVAVLILLLFDPLIARSLGFALSVTATAGIVYAAPPLVAALEWLPRWLAEAIAVPTAAQLACTPLVAAISGQVSLAAILANLAAGPAVGPATVLGLAAALVGLVNQAAGRLIGWGAVGSASWIISVARAGAAMPNPAVSWSSGWVALTVLTMLSLALILVLPRLVRRRWVGILAGIALVLSVVVRPPAPGWPPTGWVLVACDVGQGDALVLNAGDGVAVVVDAGPDPALVDRCLSRLRITAVPLVVLTHFHADHADGLTGVAGLSGLGHRRRLNTIAVTSLEVPADRVRAVASFASSRGLREGTVAAGDRLQVGQVSLEAVWPTTTPLAADDDGSGPNNASVVLLARVDGVSMLLAGDVEPLSQSALARSLAGLRVDVLKVPHHGSKYQDEAFLSGLGARVGVISVGADNDYGHPAEQTIRMLSAAGMQVRRTDRDGDIAIVVRDGRLLTLTHDFERAATSNRGY